MRELWIVIGLVVTILAMVLLGPMAPLLAIVLAVYFLPTIFARSRHKANLGAVFTLNLLAGWTGIGWLIALVWSLTSPAGVTA